MEAYISKSNQDASSAYLHSFIFTVSILTKTCIVSTMIKNSEYLIPVFGLYTSIYTIK